MVTNGHGLGFEQKLWSAADKMRNNMDAADTNTNLAVAEKKAEYKSGKKHGQR